MMLPSSLSASLLLRCRHGRRAPPAPSLPSRGAASTSLPQRGLPSPPWSTVRFSGLCHSVRPPHHRRSRRPSIDLAVAGVAAGGWGGGRSAPPFVRSSFFSAGTATRSGAVVDFDEKKKKSLAPSFHSAIMVGPSFPAFAVASSRVGLRVSSHRCLHRRSFSSTWNWSKLTTPPSPGGTDDDSSDGGGGAAPSESSSRRDDDGTVDASVRRRILSECESFHSSVMPLNSRLSGPLAKNSDRGTSMPFVFLVGNHSSGKSSFVNYVLGRDVQTAGVAPTDDCFTVVAPGPADADRDGPALVGDPDMGFDGLRQFGPSLIHHSQLKVRSGTRCGEFMMVDSPGMIDSPGGGMAGPTDRGYDFPGVVRWFAERADVVLLFFDPDKPGTTGETLSVLLHSLGGMDHKLLIVLNKADQFKKIHDFARAYGSLCWNLSKVIPRKDLPRIYTMCLPIQKPGGENDDDDVEGSSYPAENGRHRALDDRALADLHQTRMDVLAEVMKAPKRRIDNVITHLHDSVRLLLMHAIVAEDVRSRYSKRAWEDRIRETGAFVTGMGLAALGLHFQAPPQLAGGVVAATVLSVGGVHWYNASKLREEEERLLLPEELSASFQRTHAREVSDADEYAASIWQRIRDPLRLSLDGTGGLKDFPTVGKEDIEELHRLLDEEIPRLRRLASPLHYGSKR